MTIEKKMSMVKRFPFHLSYELFSSQVEIFFSFFFFSFFEMLMTVNWINCYWCEFPLVSNSGKESLNKSSFIADDWLGFVSESISSTERKEM